MKRTKKWKAIAEQIPMSVELTITSACNEHNPLPSSPVLVINVSTSNLQTFHKENFPQSLCAGCWDGKPWAGGYKGCWPVIARFWIHFQKDTGEWHPSSHCNCELGREELYKQTQANCHNGYHYCFKNTGNYQLHWVMKLVWKLLLRENTPQLLKIFTSLSIVCFYSLSIAHVFQYQNVLFV